MRNDESAAVTAAAALFEQPEEETTTEPAAEQETPEGEAPQETEEELAEELFASFEVELPEDLEEELSAPTAEEIQQELEGDEEYQELDEEGRRLLARARHAEREAQHYRDLRVKDESAKWKTEATKFFPLSAPFLNEINADSRRGFLRAAKARHEAVLPLVKPITEQARLEVEKAKAEAKVEARAEAEKAWGKPATERTVPTEASITQDDLTRNRAKGDLTSTLRAMMFPKKGAE